MTYAEIIWQSKPPNEAFRSTDIMFKRIRHKIASDLPRKRHRKGAHNVRFTSRFSSESQVSVPLSGDRDPDDELRYWRDIRSEGRDYDTIMASANATLTSRRRPQPHQSRAVSYPAAITQHEPQNRDASTLIDQFPSPPGRPGDRAYRASVATPYVRYPTDKQAESSARAHAPSYSGSRALTISPKAAALHDEVLRATDRPTSGSVVAPQPVIPLHHPHPISNGTSSSPSLRHGHVESSTGTWAYHRHQETEALNSDIVDIDQKSRAIEVPTPETSPTFSLGKDKCPPLSPGLEDTEQAESSRDSQFRFQEQEREHPHGASIATSKEALIAERSRLAVAVELSPQAPNCPSYRVVNPYFTTPASRHIEYAGNLSKAPVCSPQPKFDDALDATKLISLEEEGRRHATFVMSVDTWIKLRYAYRMNQDLDGLYRVLRDILMREDFLSTIKRRLELGAKVKIPGAFPDTDEDFEAEQLNGEWARATRLLGICDQPYENLETEQREQLLITILDQLDTCQQDRARLETRTNAMNEDLRSRESLIVSDLMDAMANEPPMIFPARDYELPSV